MIIQICVGSSCHLKGSSEIVQLLQKAVDRGWEKDTGAVAALQAASLLARIL